jgi:hypothetical protein
LEQGSIPRGRADDPDDADIGFGAPSSDGQVLEFGPLPVGRSRSCADVAERVPAFGKDHPVSGVVCQPDIDRPPGF